MPFPTIRAIDLNRRTLTVPRDLEGRLHLALVAFQMWHQQHIDTWLPLAEEIEQASGGEVVYYEFPVIQDRNFLARAFINEGMRAGIRDVETRGRTLTLYVDVAAFLQALDLPGADQIYVLLIDHEGRIVWRTAGPYEPAKAEGLREAALPLLSSV